MQVAITRIRAPVLVGAKNNKKRKMKNALKKRLR